MNVLLIIGAAGLDEYLPVQVIGQNFSGGIQAGGTSREKDTEKRTAAFNP